MGFVEKSKYNQLKIHTHAFHCYFLRDTLHFLTRTSHEKQLHLKMWGQHFIKYSVYTVLFMHCSRVERDEFDPGGVETCTLNFDFFSVS